MRDLIKEILGNRSGYECPHCGARGPHYCVGSRNKQDSKVYTTKDIMEFKKETQ
jgi:hypothetical protein